MITIDVVVARFSSLDRRDLDRWIANEWVKPESRAGEYLFREIDVARIRLIQQLIDDLLVNEEALPVVLSLLDQLYRQRRRMRELGDALLQILPEDMRENLALHLTERTRPIG